MRIEKTNNALNFNSIYSLKGNLKRSGTHKK